MGERSHVIEVALVPHELAANGPEIGTDTRLGGHHKVKRHN